MMEFYKNKFTDPVLLEIFRERAVEMIMEGLRPDDLVRWRLGELFAEAPMNGIYVPALGDYDLNEDGYHGCMLLSGDETICFHSVRFC
ncbi:MAG: hypothetical protein EZS26_003333 [Candidatus Ordinivivax streblomastigis]|uniref:RagB/SusD domain-containing protein n=1 Tax=Candidatus Ordinivivax streblomastigis TaxID=2540710 RepID=A0A5M8NW16_9BACT|nr:MAG: hypothetical protein EZS26_003333 [Candidatus Ordinivivax streblomastigis]